MGYVTSTSHFGILPAMEGGYVEEGEAGRGKRTQSVRHHQYRHKSYHQKPLVMVMTGRGNFEETFQACTYLGFGVEQTVSLNDWQGCLRLPIFHPHPQETYCLYVCTLLGVWKDGWERTAEECREEMLGCEGKRQEVVLRCQRKWDALLLVLLVQLWEQLCIATATGSLSEQEKREKTTVKENRAKKNDKKGKNHTGRDERRG